MNPSLRIPALRCLRLAAAVSLSLVVASAADALPTVDEVLDRYVQALGGRAAVEKISSRVITGQAESSMMPTAATWRYFAKKPNKRLSEVEVPGWGAIADGFDGTVAWNKNPGSAPVERSGAELAKIKRESEFERDLKLKQLYPGLAVKGVEKVGDDETLVTEAKQADGTVDRFYFSRKTGLLLRQDSEFVSDGNTMKTSALFEDYRTVDGIKVPFLMRITAGSGAMDMSIALKLSDVKQNVPLEDAKFAKPAN